MKDSSVWMMIHAMKKHSPNKSLIQMSRLTTHCHNATVAAMSEKNVRSHSQNETDVAEFMIVDQPHSDDKTHTAGNVNDKLKRKREFVDDTCSNSKRRKTTAGLQHDDFAIPPCDVHCEPVKSRGQTNWKLKNRIETNIVRG